MKRGLIGLLGAVLVSAGCVLYVMVSQTAMHAWVFVGQDHGGTEYQLANPEYPTYPLAQQMGQLWSPDALVYVNLYLSVLAVCVGSTLVLVCINSLGTSAHTKQSGVGRAGWVALCTSLVIGVVVANASPFSGGAFPPWNPFLYLLALLNPLTALDLLTMSILLSLVGFTLKSRSGRAGWVALLMAVLFGMVLANVSGWAFPPLNPCLAIVGCPPWHPGPFGLPIWTLLQTGLLAALAVLAMSVLLSLVGSFLAWRTRGAPTPVVVRVLQLAPLLMVTLIGLAALFLFPLPYAL